MSVYVGIGASAGGLKVLEKLVGSLPVNSEYIFIIAQHLDANKKSSLADILSRTSAIPVLDADVECKFFTNNIYVIPSQYNLVVKNHRLVLEEQSTGSTVHTPSINTLFESLAIYKSKDSVGVILTGSGDDGTLGLKKIKDNGGVTIVQSPDEAAYSSMPQSAIDSMEVDYVLPIKEIGEYFFNPLKSEKYLMSTSLKTIIKLLNAKEKLNIHKYKHETIIRRIHKRMLLLHLATIEEYVDYLSHNQDELSLLRQDILIGVTEFFRGKEAFESLETELFSYLEDKPENYELRIWSVACSSGEEAYSLAILIAKISEQLNRSFDVHIFATDIDDRALTKARKAFYSKESLEGMDTDLIDEYFIAVEDGYKVIPSLRQQIVFTHHNILSDPPFVNQNVISCRNLLIYILPEAQKDIFALFHHSLKNNGLLFLGSSESTMLSPEYFTPINAEHKIYKKEKVNNPPKLSSHYFSKHLDTQSHITPQQEIKKDIKSIEDRLNDTVFSFFAPNCIVVNEKYSMVYTKGELPFLKRRDGFTTLDLLENLDENLHYDVRLLMGRAFESHEIQTTKFIEIELPSSKKIFLKITASPFNDEHHSSMLLLYFQELSSDELQFNTGEFIVADESSMLKNLSTQLNTSRNELHALSDELVIYKENTQALSEELQSTNEELQSSNEELETSNEELHSSNEELQSSILDTQKLKDELSLILNSSQDAIIGLDMEGNHTFANSAAQEILGFSLNELIGKNGHHLWHHTKKDGSNYPIEDCAFHSALQHGEYTKSEDVFYKKNGSPFEVEVLQNPIIKNKKIIGTVLSFHDVTEKNKLKKISEYEQQLADLYLNVSGNIVMKLDIHGNIDMINKNGSELLGTTQEYLIGKNWFDNFIRLNNIDEIKAVFRDIRHKKTQMISNYKNVIVDTHGKEHLISWVNSLLHDIKGNIIGIISSGTDITQEKALLEKLSAQEHLYKLTFEEADIGIAHVSLDGIWIDTNEYLTNLLGYTKDEFKKLSIKDITYPEDIAYNQDMIDKLINNKRDTYHSEKRYIHKNGDIIWVSLNVVVLKDELGKPIYLLKIIRDITEIKLLVYQLEIEKNEFKRIIEFTPIPIIIHSKGGEIVLVNKAFEENTGYSIRELPNMHSFMEIIYRGVDDKAKNQLKDDYEITSLTRQIEHVISTRSGEKHTWLLKSAALHDDIHQQEVFISSVIDITDIKNKDEIMIAQSRQAAMGDMLAMVAHQWRQPLSVLSMSANIIRAEQELEGTVTEDEIRDFIRTIEQQTQYLSTTIDDFRSFFRPEKTKEKIALSSILDKLMTLVDKSLENHSISVELPKNQDIEIFTYPNQLIQVMLNFINNAKDAIKEKSSLAGLIKVTIEEEKGKVKIGVCDNGGGIDPSVKDTISQPYVSTKSKNGTGLGLYMSVMIAEQHLGGRIYWTSDKSGSCFYIALPEFIPENGDD